MKLLVKSNRKTVEMSADVYNKLRPDQKAAYQVIDKKDAPAPKDQVVTNEEKKQTPGSGDKEKAK